jgi:hypothetical protein
MPPSFLQALPLPFPQYVNTVYNSQTQEKLLNISQHYMSNLSTIKKWINVRIFMRWLQKACGKMLRVSSMKILTCWLWNRCYLRKELAVSITLRNLSGPQLSSTVESVRYWRLLLKCSKGLPIKQSSIQRAWTNAGLLDDRGSEDLPTIIRKLREALSTLRRSQKSYVELRETYLYGLAESIVLLKRPHLEHKDNAETLSHLTNEQIECLIVRECRRRMFLTIGNILKPKLLHSGISKLISLQLHH